MALQVCHGPGGLRVLVAIGLTWFVSILSLLLIAVPSTWTRRAGRWVAAMAPSARRRPRTSPRAGSQ